MPQPHESETFSTASEFGQPFSVPSDRYERGYAAAVRDDMDRMYHEHETGASERRLYDGPLGIEGEPMVGRPTEAGLEAETASPMSAPSFNLSPQRERHIDPRAEKLTEWRLRGDRSDLPAKEAPGRVLRWLKLESVESDDDRTDETSASDETQEPASSRPMSIREEVMFEFDSDEYDGVEDYDSFAEARDRIQEEIEAAYEAHERDEAEAAIDRERRYRAEVAAFQVAEGYGEVVRPSIFNQFPHTPASIEEYKAFLASKGQDQGAKPAAWQLNDPVFHAGSATERAA